jgi:hypothetical protein
MMKKLAINKAGCIVIPLKKEHGIWVFRSGQSFKAVSLADVIEEVREERSLDLLQ